MQLPANNRWISFLPQLLKMKMSPLEELHSACPGLPFRDNLALVDRSLLPALYCQYPRDSAGAIRASDVQEPTCPGAAELLVPDIVRPVARHSAGDGLHRLASERCSSDAKTSCWRGAWFTSTIWILQ
ncbi:hypothetical protein OH76DRAFT_910808 [Lentinus brumalis]|uniref:Uncharacterized protein n=1 Tax=Lentinus brumalis TaxID=2498619 RepID=A0A371D006_9APHY|nr:hypothetical protein OH76DRAFT_910808 [Polyporus brumalis]